MTDTTPNRTNGRANARGDANATRETSRDSRTRSERLPPQAVDAEKSLIGCVLLEPNCLDDVSQIVRQDDFYISGMGLIFATALAMHAAGSAVDAVTLGERLAAENKLADAGGPENLVECIEAVPHAAHAAHYAKIIAGKSRFRQIIHACTDTLRAAYDESGEADELAANTETALHKILERQVASKPVPIVDELADILADLDKPDVPGVGTGFFGVDALTSGMQPGALIILAARSTVGKTALAGGLALQVAEAGEAVLFFSLEQSRRELAQRLLCAGSGVSMTRLRSKNLPTDDRENLAETAAMLGVLKLTIDDTPGRTVSQISAVSRLQKRRDGLSLVIVDYLQFVEPDDRRIPREQQVAEITRGLKNMAKSLSIPVICLAQLNRQIENRENKRPRLADLRESGAIEQDADMVWFIDRPGSYDDKADPEAATLIVAKNRNGQTGDVPLRWVGSRMRFYNPPTAEAAETLW